jgi:hypothetical protein
MLKGGRSCWVGSPAGSAGWSCRQRVGAFLLGLLADLPRKNCWTIAEHAGDATPAARAALAALQVDPPKKILRLDPPDIQPGQQHAG